VFEHVASVVVVLGGQPTRADLHGPRSPTGSPALDSDHWLIRANRLAAVSAPPLLAYRIALHALTFAHRELNSETVSQTTSAPRLVDARVASMGGTPRFCVVETP